MNAWWRGMALVATTGALLAMAASSGCGSSRKNKDNGGGGGGGGGGGTSTSELNFTIQSADVPASGNPTVKFRVTDAAGNPVDDLATEITNDAATAPKPAPRVTPHFTLAQLENDGTYTNYYETTVDAQAYTDASGAAQTPTGSAVQPRTEPPSSAPFPASQLAANGDGVYTYTFSTPTTDAAKLDRTLTHTVGIYGTRTVSTSGTEVAYPASATFNFVPGGGQAQKIEMVTDAACNACHGVLEAHDRRRGTQLCITCHAGDRTTPYADPETQNTIDFRVMIHRIHSGQAGYHIVGFRQTDQDFSDVGFPQDIRNCTKCHSGANGDNWKTQPSALACTACHQNVKFDSSAAGFCTLNHAETAPCNHVSTSGLACNTCHRAGDTLGPDTVHVNPAAVASSTFKYEILGVTVDANRVPTVQYHVLQNGTAMALDADPWTHGSASRLFVDIGWPSTEYDNQGSGSDFGQPVSINALPPSVTGGTATPVAGQTNVYQVVSPVPIPAGVTDVTVALEGHPAIPDPYNAGGFLRVPVVNDVKYVNASGATGNARRQVVSVDNCNVCHQQLSLHGNNRTGTTQVCVICHNPSATDGSQVPSGGTAEPIDFKVLIHEVHADKIRQNEVTIFGFGGNPTTFPIGFPGQVGDCNICHVNNSFQLPLQPVVHDTINPAGGTTPKTIAVCTACHDTVKFDNSASQACGPGVTGDCNHSGGQQSGDAACAACHGAGGIADVAKVHPITTPQ